MPTPSFAKLTAPSPVLLALANAVPNVLWSALSLGPLCMFGYQHMARPWLWALGAASLLGYVLPAAWLRRLQLSPGPARYRQLGVPALNRFTQNGTIVNGLLRRRCPQHRPVLSRAAAARLVRTSYQQERFHWSMLGVFGLASGYALGQGLLGWATLLTLLNVGYNLYPIWLQQYLRLRLARVLAAGPA